MGNETGKIMQEYTGYRPNVAAIILSSDYDQTGYFVIARRTGVRRGWQFPQGGIDDGETPREALLRELLEEIGTNDVEILGEYPEWIQYDFPDTKSTKVYPFRGQRQRYFLVRLNPSANVNLLTEETPEFEECKRVTSEELFKRVTYFKRPSYRRVINYFKNKGQL
jgi:putative (di)nucleoside polyphosphate hydrolase